ncbi:MAG: UDP-3-O-acyl-N-acetylglucosamine deacetylase [Nitrospinota bacterium]|nr:UDP-3-O-acyl-N-acetylglucosamine deacetylase [Nitrospinota bacterium]
MSKKSILIVDDEKNIVSSLEGILSDEGYDVTSTEDGLDALEIVQSDPPNLVLLDIWIPGMDGIEVLKNIKAYNPKTDVLIMSGHASIDTAVKATKLGAYDFIEKPFSLDRLVKSVKNVFKEKKDLALPDHRKFTGKIDLLLSFRKMMDVKKKVQKAADSRGPVLLLGEKGTGKLLVAQEIHNQSAIGDRPFVKLDCAVRRMLDIQSQLFSSNKEGCSANTKPQRSAGAGEKALFLGNLEALTKGMQEKLADALKGDGSRKEETPLNLLPARLFAASSKDLKALAKRGSFNPDLLKVLSETLIEIPPLRKSAAEIPNLVRSYIQDPAKTERASGKMDEEAMEALCQYHWPENMKELRLVLEQVLANVSEHDKITLEDLPAAIRRKPRTDENKTADSGSKRGKAPRLMQRTLKRSVVLCGSGLHSGIKTGLILQPLPPGSGVIFGDISSGDTISARLTNVESTDYSTCLKKGFTSVATIEHIMAVLHMYRITNLLIKIGDEVPVMDGSAKDFCRLMEDGDFEEQDEPYKEIVIDKYYSFGSKENGKPFISIEPTNKFTVQYHMEYPEPIGVQDFAYEFTGEESFKTQIAPARTFGFLEDVAQLTKMGFASGGKLDNFILLGDKKVLNTELRYKDEFARHKILDIIGDFYLLGRPIRGLIKAHKSGHTENIGLLKKIQAGFSESLPAN